MGGLAEQIYPVGLAPILESQRQRDYDVSPVIAVTTLEVAPMNSKKKVSLGNVIPLRAKGSEETTPFRELGYSPMARHLAAGARVGVGFHGHWCSYCQGIWFGYLLEAECPVCGRRSG